jgi:hypothetical protein
MPDEFGTAVPVKVKIEGDIEYRDKDGNLLGTAHISGVLPLQPVDKDDDHGSDN